MECRFFFFMNSILEKENKSSSLHSDHGRVQCCILDISQSKALQSLHFTCSFHLPLPICCRVHPLFSCSSFALLYQIGIAYQLCHWLFHLSNITVFLCFSPIKFFIYVNLRSVSLLFFVFSLLASTYSSFFNLQAWPSMDVHFWAKSAQTVDLKGQPSISFPELHILLVCGFKMTIQIMFLENTTQASFYIQERHEQCHVPSWLKFWALSIKFLFCNIQCQLVCWRAGVGSTSAQSGLMKKCDAVQTTTTGPHRPKFMSNLK